MNFIVKAIMVKQPVGKFYICKMNASELTEMASVDILRISSDSDNLYKGIQRRLIPDKVKSLKGYLTTRKATFPNTIIVNVEESNFVSFTNDELVLKRDKSTFTILDGQHRLEGLKESKCKDFEVAVSIFVGLAKEDQSKIFITINTEQTKVDPSVGLYQEKNSIYYTPRKMVVKLAEMFSIDKNSPWHNKLKMLGRKDEISEEGILSLKAFSRPILASIYDDSQSSVLLNILETGSDDYSEIKTGYLWDMYLMKNESGLYKILFNYFSAVKTTFPNDWGNHKSLLTKTTGYNAMMMLFQDLYLKGLENGDLSNDYFTDSIKYLKRIDETINSSNFAPSGDRAAKELYNHLKQVLRREL